MTLRYHADALREIREAAHWYDQRQPGLGDEFLEAVEQTAKQITEHPLHFPKINGRQIPEASDRSRWIGFPTH